MITLQSAGHARTWRRPPGVECSIGVLPGSATLDQGDEALVSKDGDGEMEGDSEVSQPLVGADIQLHSFGEPLPNVWAMRATGEWDAFEAKRAEFQDTHKRLAAATSATQSAADQPQQGPKIEEVD